MKSIVWSVVKIVIIVVVMGIVVIVGIAVYVESVKEKPCSSCMKSKYIEE